MKISTRKLKVATKAALREELLKFANSPEYRGARHLNSILWRQLTPHQYRYVGADVALAMAVFGVSAKARQTRKRICGRLDAIARDAQLQTLSAQAWAEYKRRTITILSAMADKLPA